MSELEGVRMYCQSSRVKSESARVGLPDCRVGSRLAGGNRDCVRGVPTAAGVRPSSRARDVRVCARGER